MYLIPYYQNEFNIFKIFSEIFPKTEPTVISAHHSWKGVPSWPHNHFQQIFDSSRSVYCFITKYKDASDIFNLQDLCRLMKPAGVTVVIRLLCSGGNWRTYVSAFAEWGISAAVVLELRGLLFVVESLIAFGIILQPQEWAPTCYSLACYWVKATK